MLRPMSRLTNLEKSLNVYLRTQLVDVYNEPRIVFPRETFGETLPSQWIEVSYIPLSAEFPVGLVHIGWGSSRTLLVNANCFEQIQDQLGQSGSGGGQYTLSLLVDSVQDVLGPRATIPIRDYSTLGYPIVAYFGWRDLSSRRVPVDVNVGLEQWNVSATLAYSEEHT